jgi:hypothetical protein
MNYFQVRKSSAEKENEAQFADQFKSVWKERNNHYKVNGNLIMDFN